ncbi:MAG: patatin-like phospholipase family protein [Oleibacter sp.]|nr:patatin-like phospholipase family protein [Thalassolituus sp.]
MKTARRKIALALGSGGARGYTHIGVIQAIEERGYDIVSISGCSMGAIVGGFYAAGKLDDYRKWVVGLGYLDVLRLLDFSFLSGGALKLEKVYTNIEEMLGGCLIEDLNIPFTSVATDLISKKEVWFQRGSLVSAMRASAAIPSILAPVSMDNMLLVDGAVLNPLPITPCVSAHAELIIAVDLNADVPLPMNLIKGVDVAEEEKSAWLDTIVSKASGWFGGKADDARKEADNSLGKIETLSRMFEVMQSSISRFKTAGYPPDLLIRIPSSSCEMYEFYRAQEMIDIGYQVAMNALDAFEYQESSIYAEIQN